MLEIHMTNWTQEDLKDNEGNKYEKVIIPLPGDQFKSKDGEWLPIKQVSKSLIGTDIKIRRKLK